MQLIGRSFDEATLLRSAPRSSAPPTSTTRCRSSHDQPRRDRQPQHPLHRRAHRSCRQRSQLSLGEGEVLGLLGESGSGKSVTLRALMRLLPKKRTQISGSVKVLGRDVLALDDEELSAFRGQTVSMIFQEPALALDPVYTIGGQIAETVMRHEGKSQTRGDGAGAGDAGGGADSLRQAPARCLSARDVRRHAPARDDRAGAGLQAENPAGGRADHRARCHRADPDPAAAARIAARVRHVRHLRHPRYRRRHRNLRPRRGDVCRPDRRAGHAQPDRALAVHPYARGLLASTVHGAKRGQRLETIPGTPPSLDKAPTNCSFAPRCAFAEARCIEQLPPNVQIGPDRIARCILAERCRRLLPRRNGRRRLVRPASFESSHRAIMGRLGTRRAR